jgi:hypothetical protein
VVENIFGGVAVCVAGRERAAEFEEHSDAVAEEFVTAEVPASEHVEAAGIHGYVLTGVRGMVAGAVIWPEPRLLFHLPGEDHPFETGDADLVPGIDGHLFDENLFEPGAGAEGVEEVGEAVEE